MHLLKMIGKVENLDLDELSNRDMVDIIASMVESGEVWELENRFGQVAMRLIDEGYIDSTGTILKYP